jgi:hypothetical protein
VIISFLEGTEGRGWHFMISSWTDFMLFRQADSSQQLFPSVSLHVGPASGLGSSWGLTLLGLAQVDFTGIDS